MTDEEFEKNLTDLVEMLKCCHRINDKSLTKYLKVEIKELTRKMLK